MRTDESLRDILQWAKEHRDVVPAIRMEDEYCIVRLNTHDDPQKVVKFAITYFELANVGMIFVLDMLYDKIKNHTPHKQTIFMED